MNVNSVTSLGAMSYLKYATSKSNSTFKSVDASASTSNSYLFGSISSNSASGYLFGSLPSTSNSALWNTIYSDSDSNKTAILSMMKKYTTTSNKFYSSFATTSTSLQSSSLNLAETLNSSSSSTSDIVDSIASFVSDYNDATDLFSKNSDVSTALSGLAKSFSTGTKNSRNVLSSIGITVDTSGKMTVDQNTLTDAVKNDYDTVKSVLSGSTGLANQAYSKITLAMNSASNLVPFPDVSSLTSSSTSLGLLADLYA